MQFLPTALNKFLILLFNYSKTMQYTVTGFMPYVSYGKIIHTVTVNTFTQQSIVYALYSVP